MVPNVMVDISIDGNNVTITLSWGEPFSIVTIGLHRLCAYVFMYMYMYM